jgi:hypothetical protein
MNIKFLKATIVSVLAAISGFSNAAIINSGDVAGYGTFTDDVSGYVWLDINAFFGSAGNIFTTGQMATLANDAGFSVATTSEVVDLFNSVTIPGNFAYNEAVMGRSNDRFLIWGMHLSDGGGGLFDYSWIFDYSTSLQFMDRNDPASFKQREVGLWAYQTGASTSGSTSVPEPSTLAIFALGIIGLASRRFKKQA